MDSDNRLSRLGGNLQDALESIQSAIREGHALNEVTHEDDPGWPALDELLDRLDVMIVTLSTALEGQVGEAIKAANDYLDDLADRADGASY